MDLMPIRRLSELLINQIAAGEVIERPASVVKELIDNGLDAGATRIDIAVEEGGRRLIRVADNGCGIPEEELPLAVAPHATSKLCCAEDLGAIRTLGFRGEALASIASVSRLRLISRLTVGGCAAESGAVIEACGDRVTRPAPAPCSPGTVVEVRDLFFNTPVRRKSLRPAATEFGHIVELFTRIAMANPGVGFRLTHNGRAWVDLPAGQSRRQRCVQLLGWELEEALLEFESDCTRITLGSVECSSGSPHLGDGADSGPGLELWGLAGLPAIARATAKFQYLCVNGRPIRDRTLAHAVKEAYRGLIPADQQPVAVVCLEVPPGAVDVNVHPAKAEVRFHDPNRLHGLVLTAIRQRLLAADLTPSVSLAGGAGAKPRGDWPAVSPGSAPGPTAGAPSLAISTDAFVDYFRRMDPTQKGFVYQQVREALAEDSPAALLDTGGLSDAAGRSYAVSASPSPSQLPAGHEPLLPRSGSPGDSGGGSGGSASAPVLQIHNSYLVTQDEQGLIIIDQHALHERVLFEELSRRVLGRNLESQRLLTPAVVRASPQRLALLDLLKPLLERIGVEADALGPDAVAIHAFPSFLFDRRVDPVDFFESLLDLAQDSQLLSTGGGAGDSSANVDEAVLHRVLDMMACKAAVKAGDPLSPLELQSLLVLREQVERASSCPHGRPTTVRLTLQEMARRFKRT